MWEECKKLQEELVRMRRELHQIPEVGDVLPETRSYVEGKLKEYGIPFTENSHDSGLIAVIKGGKPGKTLALRADMDALPITEENEVDYDFHLPLSIILTVSLYSFTKDSGDTG